MLKMGFCKEEGIKGRKIFVETSPRREREFVMGMEVMVIFGGKEWKDLFVGQWPCLCKTRVKGEGKGWLWEPRRIGKWWSLFPLSLGCCETLSR